MGDGSRFLASRVLYGRLYHRMIWLSSLWVSLQPHMASCVRYGSIRIRRTVAGERCWVPGTQAQADQIIRNELRTMPGAEPGINDSGSSHL